MQAFQLTDELRYKLLNLLYDNPQLSQRQLAKATGMSLGKVNYCVKALVDIGFVKLGNFKRSENKVGYVYILTPKGLAEKAQVTLRFLDYKQRQFDCLKNEIEALRKQVLQENLVK